MLEKHFCSLPILLIILLHQTQLLESVVRHEGEKTHSNTNYEAYKHSLLNFLVNKIVNEKFTAKDLKLVTLLIALVIKERDNRVREEKKESDRIREENTVYWYSRQG